jgi:hypothetical protein
MRYDAMALLSGCFQPSDCYPACRTVRDSGPGARLRRIRHGPPLRLLEPPVHGSNALTQPNARLRSHGHFAAWWSRHLYQLTPAVLRPSPRPDRRTRRRSPVRRRSGGASLAEEAGPVGAVLGAGGMQAGDLPIAVAIHRWGQQGMHVDRANPSRSLSTSAPRWHLAK